MATADIGAVVTDFVADPRRASLELPHMTTGQRKAAKKLLENYPELRCESYGFGPERQLHIFKKCADQAEQEERANASAQKCDLTPLGVNVKNTFIDDWDAPKPEAIVFRSLPMRTDGKKMLDLTSLVKEFQGDCTEDVPVPKADAGSAADGQEMVLPLMDKELQVRNTFIHFDMSVDERNIQSMPHGMFKQCLLAESSEEATGYETPTTVGCNTLTSASEVDLHELCSPLAEAKEEKRWSLCPGALVVVEGLVKAAAFNGRSAVVQSWDEESGRYSILLASPNGSQEAKIKEENLRVVLPCPDTPSQDVQNVPIIRPR